MSNPWNGKVVLETFWWNCWNENYPADWYTYLAKLAPRLAAMGFDGIWTPPPCKDTIAQNNMGYTPYDFYDLGQKNQKGAAGTRFGTQDAFLRLVAVAHANGLEVYPDIVLDHCGSGDLDPSSPFESTSALAFTGFHPNSFAGPGTGRWPRNWLDFHANPQHWHGSGDWVANNGGPDFCYQGRCTDSGSGNLNCSSRANARAWFTWFVHQTGVDGFRFDDVKGFPPEVVEDLLFNAMGDHRDYFCVGEFVTGASSDLDAWTEATLNRAGAFDYPLRFAFSDLVSQNGFSDVGRLPSLQQQNRFKTVPFVNNHDNYDGQVGAYLDPDNPRTQLACAFAVTVDGSPQLFYADLFRNIPPWRDKTTAAEIPTRSWMENLVWCHQKLAFKSGDYFVRYQNSQQLLILDAALAPSSRSTMTAAPDTTPGSPPPLLRTPSCTTTAAPAPTTSGPMPTLGCISPFHRSPTPSGGHSVSLEASLPHLAARYNSSKWTMTSAIAIRRVSATAAKLSPASSAPRARFGPPPSRRSISSSTPTRRRNSTCKSCGLELQPSSTALDKAAPMFR